MTMETRAIAGQGPINRRWLPLNALRAFEAVGRHLSFTAGAQALTVTQSAVSRHVAGLEDLIGAPLFDRGAAGLRLTPAGASLLPVVSKSLDRIEQAVNAIRETGGGARPLRVHMPPSLLQQLALPLLHEFHAGHPDIRIDIVSSNVTGPPPGDVDMAIVFDRPRADDQITDLLWMVRVAPLCSPTTAALHAGKSLEHFLGDCELLHVKLEGEPRGMLWSRYADQQRLSIDTDRGMAFDTTILAVSYAMTAPGVVLGDIDLCRTELADRRLVMPFDRPCADGYGYYLKTHAEDLGDPAIGLFRAWVLRHFGVPGGPPGADVRASSRADTRFDL